MEYTKEQLQLIRTEFPELIKKPEPSLNDAIVEFLKKYEVFVKPPKDRSRLDGAIAGAVTGIAGADVGGDAFLISGQNKQTKVQEWTQWKQWALDHKDFPKFQTDFYDEVHEYNRNIDDKLEDPEFQKKVERIFSDKEQRDKDVQQAEQLLAIFGGVILIFIVGFVYTQPYRDQKNNNSSFNPTNKTEKIQNYIS